MKTGNTETMRSRVQALTADLERQVQELFDSDRYREFLDAMAKFHHYSLNNSLLSELTKSRNKKVDCPVFKRSIRSLIYCMERVVGIHLVYLHLGKSHKLEVEAGICSGNAVVVFSDKSADALLLAANGYLCSRRSFYLVFVICIVEFKELQKREVAYRGILEEDYIRR